LITAYIPDTGLSSTLAVRVKNERAYNQPDIITMFILSPCQAPFYIIAVIISFGFGEADSDNLICKLNYTEEQKNSPMY
jgi:hypothetical protein